MRHTGSAAHDVTDVGRVVLESKALGHVTQMQRPHVEDVLHLSRVRRVRPHRTLVGYGQTRDQYVCAIDVN